MTKLVTKRLLAGALAAALLQAGSASALSLLEAYDLALKNDPAFQAAQQERLAGQEYAVLGRANLLPSLSINYSKTKNKAEITQPSALTGTLVTNDRDYDAKTASLQLRQPLINLDGIARFKQGKAQASYSESVFSGRSQELAVRVTTAYADAQIAEDQLTLVTAQRDALQEQMRANERMFQRGEGTKTDMLETQARYDLASAQLIEAKDNVAITRNVLEAIIGKEVTRLDPLAPNFRIKPLQPASFDEWKTIALANNAEIASLTHTVEVAHQEVNKALAGHAPRVDFIASYSNNSSETINTLNQESKVRAVGFQLSIPLYSGGAVSASSRQASANYEKAKAERDAKIKQVLVELRKQYDIAQNSAVRIDALVKSVNSAEALVEATRQSIKGGVRVNLDLLTAQQQMFAAKRDLTQARHAFLLSFLRLRYAAGQLTADDMRGLSGYFVASR